MGERTGEGRLYGTFLFLRPCFQSAHGRDFTGARGVEGKKREKRVMSLEKLLTVSGEFDNFIERSGGMQRARE